MYCLPAVQRIRASQWVRAGLLLMVLATCCYWLAVEWPHVDPTLDQLHWYSGRPRCSAPARTRLRLAGPGLAESVCRPVDPDEMVARAGGYRHTSRKTVATTDIDDDGWRPDALERTDKHPGPPARVVRPWVSGTAGFS
jgi:hypothetical protein